MLFSHIIPDCYIRFSCSSSDELKNTLTAKIPVSIPEISEAIPPFLIATRHDFSSDIANLSQRDCFDFLSDIIFTPSSNFSRRASVLLNTFCQEYNTNIAQSITSHREECAKSCKRLTVEVSSRQRMFRESHVIILNETY